MLLPRTRMPPPDDTHLARFQLSDINEHIERLFAALVAGDLSATRVAFNNACMLIGSAESVVTHLLWPLASIIDRLHRSGQLASINVNMAVRLLMTAVSPNSARFDINADNHRNILVFCGSQAMDFVNAQMAVDLLEFVGFKVCFAGECVSGSDAIPLIVDQNPSVLLFFSIGAAELPRTRILIDSMYDLGLRPGMQVAVGGGIFARAPGLAEEIGADISANEPQSLARRLVDSPQERSSAEEQLHHRGFPAPTYPTPPPPH